MSLWQPGLPIFSFDFKTSLRLKDYFVMTAFLFLCPMLKALLHAEFFGVAMRYP